MTAWRRRLFTLVSAQALAMVGLALVMLSTGGTPEEMKQLTGLEIVLNAVLLIPWCLVFGQKGLASYRSDDPGYLAWQVLSLGSVLLLGSQILVFTPLFVDVGRFAGWSGVVGQMLSAVFRAALVWALWGVRRVYAEAGLGFRLRATDRVVAFVVAAAVLVMIFRRDVIGAYWTADLGGEATLGRLKASIETTNFVLYAALFYMSLTMYRYATQMRGGHLAMAWGGIAAYGILQPLHVFVVALLSPYFGPTLNLVLDNFIVLAAFASLAFGAVVHAEIAEMRQDAGAILSRA